MEESYLTVLCLHLRTCEIGLKKVTKSVGSVAKSSQHRCDSIALLIKTLRSESNSHLSGTGPSFLVLILKHLSTSTNQWDLVSFLQNKHFPNYASTKPFFTICQSPLPQEINPPSIPKCSFLPALYSLPTLQ